MNKSELFESVHPAKALSVMALPPEDADIRPAELPLTNAGDTAAAPQSAYTPVVPIEAPAGV